MISVLDNYSDLPSTAGINKVYYISNEDKFYQFTENNTWALIDPLTITGCKNMQFCFDKCRICKP